MLSQRVALLPQLHRLKVSSYCEDTHFICRYRKNCAILHSLSGAVLVLTALTTEGKHAGSRQLARNPQMSNN